MLNNATMNNTIINNDTIINTTVVKVAKDTHTIPFATLRHFLPIAASIGWLLNAFLGHIPFFAGLGTILIVIGFLFALTVCPIKLITLPFWTAVGAYDLGSIFHPIVGLIVAFSFGLPIGVGIMLYAPAAFTIYKWYKKEEKHSDEELGMCQSVETHNGNYTPVVSQYYL